MIKILSTLDMKYCDQEYCNEIGEINLINKASRALFENITFTKHNMLLAGNGNNGADVLSLSLILSEKNIPFDLYLLDGKKSESNEYFLNKLKDKNIKYFLLTSDVDFSQYSLIIDGLIGIGFHPPLSKELSNIFIKINSSKARVISIDINSGLNSDNGLTQLAIKSNLTLSLGYYKVGHFLNQAPDFIESLQNLNLNIPLIVKPYYLLEKNDVKNFIKKRRHYSNKSTYGYLALIGGSVNYSGAIKLASLASSTLRAGGGVVKLATLNSLKDAILPYLLESTFFPLSEVDNRYKFVKDEIDELISNVSTIVCGMGLTVNDETVKLIKYLLLNYHHTLILDADALNALSTLDLSILNKRKNKLIITPHLKEFSRLCKLSITEINQNPIIHAKEFAKKYHLILLLKGNVTIITDGHDVYLSNKGCPGMAVGGSGDVLSGIVGGIVSNYQEDLLMAVSSSAFINGLSGEIANREINELSLLPSDTAKNIAKALNEILEI